MAKRSKAWVEIYQRVCVDMGMPPRGPRGSVENKKRLELAPTARAIANARYKRLKRQGFYVANTPARPG